MANLSDAVPPFEPAEDTFLAVTGMAISALPLAGPLLAEGLAHAVSARQAARQHEFNVLMARELQRALNRPGSAATISDVAASDEFLAATTRAQRVAAETASENKRRRLAAAAANAGDWSGISRSERSRFGRFVEQFDDLHVWLLAYLDDSHAWRAAHGVREGNPHIATDDNPLTQIFNRSVRDWWPHYFQAARDLEDARLVSYRGMRSDAKSARQLYARTTSLGRSFLVYLNEPAPEHLPPPRDL